MVNVFFYVMVCFGVGFGINLIRLFAIFTNELLIMYFVACDFILFSVCLGIFDMRVVVLCMLNIVVFLMLFFVVFVIYLFFSSVTRSSSRNSFVYRKFVIKWCFVMNL